jgi:Zn-dependent protease
MSPVFSVRHQITIHFTFPAPLTHTRHIADMLSYLGMLSQFLANPLLGLTWAIGLILAITIHEFAHALLADRLGDPTPRLQGRLTLNPLAHLDPIGTLMLLLTRFGWGKPVQFDPFNLANPRRDAALISLAGPVSNLLTATLAAAIIRLVPISYPLLLPLIVLSISLALFNLIPIHPLDGGKIILGLLPRGLAAEWDRTLHQYGLIILILLLLPLGGISPISALLTPLISFTFNLLLP